MNTYILQTDLHQELLTQNRIDPITGDSIQEGDEVVFCAGCKSIFLKDTWEYLGEKHCNQSDTLNYIPSHSLNLKLGDDILYHIPAITNQEELKISPKVGNWIYKENNTGKYHKYFFGEEEEFGLKAIIFTSSFILLLTLIMLEVIIYKSLFFSLSFLTLLPYPIIQNIMARKYGEKVTDSYKKIKGRSLVIKTNGISLCSAYGITEIFLHLKHLRAITVSDVGFSSNRMILFEYDDDKKLTIPFNPYHMNEDNFENLLNALGKMSTNLDFPITLHTGDTKKIEIVNQLIKEKKAKFTITIETQLEYLKRKYGYLYQKTDKPEKLLSQ